MVSKDINSSIVLVGVKYILVSIRKDRYINRFYWKVLIGAKECDIDGHKGLRPALVQTTGKNFHWFQGCRIKHSPRSRTGLADMLKWLQFLSTDGSIPRNLDLTAITHSQW